MTTPRFRELIGAFLTDYFRKPAYSTERAQQWQRVPNPPIRHLERLSTYKPGEYTRRWHTQLTEAIHAAMTPHVSNVPTSHLLPEKASTPNPVEKSLILWHDEELQQAECLDEEDTDVTERRAIVRPPKSVKHTETIEIPAITGEILLMEIMRAPTSKQTTGENERIEQAENFLL